MPLVQRSSREAVSENIRREKSAGKKQSQAVAIALSVARKNRMADGGSTPWFAKSEAHSMTKSGFINSPVAGRTDKIGMKVAPGSYVIPADTISSLGQGNSLAGANAINKLFSLGPYGTSIPKGGGGAARSAKIIRQKFADGGVDEDPEIVAAGGEAIIPPDKVAELGGGDIKRGHEILDAFVKHTRKKAIKTLRKLPSPKKRR